MSYTRTMSTTGCCSETSIFTVFYFIFSWMSASTKLQKTPHLNPNSSLKKATKSYVLKHMHTYRLSACSWLCKSIFCLLFSMIIITFISSVSNRASFLLCSDKNDDQTLFPWLSLQAMNISTFPEDIISSISCRVAGWLSDMCFLHWLCVHFPLYLCTCSHSLHNLC